MQVRERHPTGVRRKDKSAKLTTDTGREGCSSVLPPASPRVEGSLPHAETGPRYGGTPPGGDEWPMNRFRSMTANSPVQ